MLLLICWSFAVAAAAAALLEDALLDFAPGAQAASSSRNTQPVRRVATFFVWFIPAPLFFFRFSGAFGDKGRAAKEKSNSLLPLTEVQINSLQILRFLDRLHPRRLRSASGASLPP